MKLKVDPREQRAFAAFLTEFSLALSWRNAELLRASERVQALWADERFREVDKKLTESSKLIQEFELRSARFVNYLNEKAFAGEKYLRR